MYSSTQQCDRLVLRIDSRTCADSPESERHNSSINSVVECGVYFLLEKVCCCFQHSCKGGSLRKDTNACVLQLNMFCCCFAPPKETRVP